MEKRDSDTKNISDSALAMILNERIRTKHERLIEEEKHDWVRGFEFAARNDALAHLDAIRAYLGIDAREME